MIPESIVQIFAADQMKVFLEISMAISKKFGLKIAIFESKLAIFKPKMAIFRPFDISETGRYKIIL